MFDWVMASDRGKQQAYCKVCSKQFSVSHGGNDDVRRHGEGLKNGFKKKNHGFSAHCPAFFSQKLNMSVHWTRLIKNQDVNSISWVLPASLDGLTL